METPVVSEANPRQVFLTLVLDTLCGKAHSHIRSNTFEWRFNGSPVQGSSRSVTPHGRP
jgi:hypothetical protein